ncbi:heat induced stress protein YflT [Paenibacillus taihuensis]|uniref:Heat induced stress protein YflT n=1 Tax=Paenibacillus taihuensis TaxID=1156355 RepID=A0A3D9R033_9BACL|nr:general stress protein [Paenibacillus taihuensis]REE66979.1 heat induced stress protein YflT [Paenibacillus taihuensis]
MTYRIGIFNTENEAIEAVQALENAGFTQHELKIITKDRDHSRRIERETNVHADEMTDLMLTRAAADDHDNNDLGVAAPVPVSGLNMGVFGGVAFPSIGIWTAAAAAYDSDSTIESALVDIGLDAGDASACRDALARGAILIAADMGDNQLADGPDLSVGGTAEAVFRDNGAARIL